MARRKIILAEGEIYHVLNRGVEKREIFTNGKDYSRFLDTTAYYQWADPPTRFSFHHRLKKLKSHQQKKPRKLIEIIAYCLMPNHFHFLLKQLMKNGITIFMSRTCNSYAKYFNTKYKRNGPLFQGNFKAVRITSNEQLIHVSRYIHLNPLVDYLTKNLKDYPFSSFPEYLGLEKGISSPKIVLDQFKTGKDYQDFVQDQKDYAQRLKEIKRLALEG